MTTITLTFDTGESYTMVRRPDWVPGDLFSQTVAMIVDLVEEE